jgi:hypothetical protein
LTTIEKGSFDDDGKLDSPLITLSCNRSKLIDLRNTKNRYLQYFKLTDFMKREKRAHKLVANSFGIWSAPAKDGFKHQYD